MRQMPLSLVTKNRSCVVVGPGDLGDAKARLAGLAGLTVSRLATVMRDEDIDAIQSGIAFVALADASQASVAAAILRRKGYLVNVADQPQLCDFILPAIVDRSPVTIAISTGGASATMARQIRGRLEAELPERLGDMVTFISALRPGVAEILTDATARRQFWDWATADGGPCDPFAHDQPPSQEEMLAAAVDFGRKPAVQSICIIHLQSNDPADMTLRGLRRLQQADVVVAVGRKETLEQVALMARRDAQILYDEMSDKTIQLLATSPRSVILFPSGAEARPIRIDGAQFEFIYAGKAQL